MWFPISLWSVSPTPYPQSELAELGPSTGGKLSSLLCTYPCCVGIADVCRCVRVCRRTGFAVPFSRAGVRCSAVVLF